MRAIRTIVQAFVFVILGLLAVVAHLRAADNLQPLEIVTASGVHPFAVDVSSGVETGGRKSKDLVEQFISNARSVH